MSRAKLDICLLRPILFMISRLHIAGNLLLEDPDNATGRPYNRIACRKYVVCCSSSRPQLPASPLRIGNRLILWR